MRTHARLHDYITECKVTCAPGPASTVAEPDDAPQVYLDTSAYNALLLDPEHAWLERRACERLDVWASYWNLSELMDTVGSTRIADPTDRARRLIELMRSLMRGRVRPEDRRELLHHPVPLMQSALSQLRERATRLKFGLEPSAYEEAFSWDWLQNRPTEEIEAQKTWKRGLRERDKGWLHEVRSGLGADAHEGAARLHDLLRAIFESNSEMDFHFRDWLEASGASEEQVTDIGATARQSLVFYPFMVAEIVRRVLVVASEVSVDVTDTVQAVYLPCVSWFITNDDGQKRVYDETVAFCYPRRAKRIMHYSELRDWLLAT